jgi:hypothetical protein
MKIVMKTEQGEGGIDQGEGKTRIYGVETGTDKAIEGKRETGRIVDNGQGDKDQRRTI